MALRCIRCNRPETKVALTPQFFCVDTFSCIKTWEFKNRKVIPVTINFDAALQGKVVSGGQPVGIGVYTCINGVHSPEYSGIKYIKWGTVTTGEWTALVAALSVAKIMKDIDDHYQFRVIGDSQVIVRCYNGKYKVADRFKQFANKADKLRQQLGMSLLGVQWVPRAKNSAADILSKEALKLAPL